MIKKGDKVMCVFPAKGSITVGKLYTIMGTEWQKKENEKSFSNVYIVVTNDFGWKGIFKFKGNFITIAEWRDRQIDRILAEQEFDGGNLLND